MNDNDAKALWDEIGSNCTDRKCPATMQREGAGKDAAPRIDTVKAIADYFGVSVDSLLQKPRKRKEP